MGFFIVQTNKLLFVIQVFILMLQEGFYMGWSSPNTARLKSNSTENHMTTEQISWLVSTGSIGGIGGAILGPVIVELIGPKNMGLVTFAFSATSWLCIWASDSFLWMFIARCLGGTMMNMAFICVALYLGEVASAKTRGTLIAIAVTGNSIGRLIGTTLETYTSKHIACPFYLILGVVGIIILTSLLDSPYYLMKVNDLEGVRKSVKMYFPNCALDDKIRDIRNYVEDQSKLSFKDKLKVFRSKSVQKSLLFIILLYSLVQTTGVMILIQFLQIVMEKAQIQLITPKQFPIFTNLLSLGSRFLTFNVYDVFGRKFLLILTSAVSAITLGCLGLHFYLLSLDFDPESIQLLPIVSIVIFKITYAVGFTTGLSAVLSEIFPPNVKGIAATLAHLFSALFGFIVTQSFLSLFYSVGEYYVFWIYAACTLLIIPSVIFLIPETKGKTLEEVHESQQRR